MFFRVVTTVDVIEEEVGAERKLHERTYIRVEKVGRGERGGGQSRTCKEKTTDGRGRGQNECQGAD